MPPAYGTAPAKPAPVYSIISLIAGIIGVLGGLGIVWIPIVGGILQLFIPAAAVVLGFIGKKKSATKGMWLTGIILGFVGMAIGLLLDHPVVCAARELRNLLQHLLRASDP